MKEDKYLVCIDNSNTIMLHESINPVHLTIGKSYKVLNESHYYKVLNESHYMITNGFYNTITIIDDSLDILQPTCDYRIERFITLQQWREQQLNKIL